MNQKKFFILNLIVVILLLILINAFVIKAPVDPENVGDNGDKKYKLSDGQSITVSYTDSNGISKDFKYENLQKDSKGNIDFTFNKDGRIIEAHFKTPEDKEYFLGNQLVPLPKGAEVDFSKGEAKVKMPADAVLKAPKMITQDKNPDAILTYTSANGKFLFENGNFFGFQNKEGILKFDGNFYFDKGDAVMNKMQIINPGIKTYIDFNGKINSDYKGAYISIDEKNGVFVTGSNVDQFGPKVNFLDGNPYGLRIKQNDHFAVQALGNPEGNYIKITNRGEKLIPKIETLNEFGINADEKTVHYNSQSEKLYLSPKVLIDGFKTGTSSVPVEITNLKTEDGKPVSISKYGNVLGITDDVEFAWGKNPSFIQTTSSYKNYPSLKKGFSNSWLYYNLKNVNDINRFLGKRLVNDYAGVLNDPKNVKWFSDLLAGLPNPVYRSIGEIRIENNIPYGNGYVAGLTHTNGLVQIAKSNFQQRTLRHEVTHAYQFRNPNGFWTDWKSVGYYVNNQNGELAPSAGAASDYGSSNLYEDGAEYGNYIYEPNYWSNLISDNNQYNKVYRGKIAVLRKHDFITQKEYDAIFRVRGLDSSNVQKYIDEAKLFVLGKR